MEILQRSGGFLQTMRHPTVKMLDCDCVQGQCSIYYVDGRVRTLTIGCTIFNSQYGIPVSPDGKTLYMTSWESGLYAISTETTNMIWHYAQRGLARLILHGDQIIAHRQGKACIALDVQTGEIMATLPCMNMDSIVELTQNYCLAWNASGRVCLIDLDTITVVRRYGADDVNPDHCLSLLIQSAEIMDGDLVLYGIERYPNGNYANGAEQNFRRTIKNWI